LISAGCDVNRTRSSDGATALHRAAWRGSEHVVQLLLNAGVDCTRQDDHRRTPLLVACQGDESETAMALLESSKCVVNVCDVEMNSALHWTVAHENQKLMTCLLAAGIDPNLRNFEGNTALTLAAGLGFTSIVITLVNNGADCDKTNYEGETAI
ncbi:hypothetical protein CAPTEDRAFT_54849, partial [Capitella teleta]